MDNHTNDTVSSNSGKVNLTKDKAAVHTKQKKDSADSFTADTGTQHSHEPDGGYSFGLLGLLVGGIRSIFNLIMTVVVLFVIAGLVTGNLKSWSRNVVYYGTCAVHTARNFSLPHKYEEGSAEYVLSEYMDALFSGDQYTADQYVDATESETVRATETIADTFRTSRSDAVMAFLVKDMSKADYEIIADSNDHTKFSLVFTTYDYQIAVDKTISELSQYDNQVLLDDSLNQSDEEIALKALKTFVYKAPKNLKFSVDFTVEENGGSYQITGFNPRELVCAMTGNLILSLDEGYPDVDL